jgi:NCAIR mutase (PurE)-related protein
MSDSSQKSDFPHEPQVRVDLDRRRRCGYAEVVFAPGKTTSAIADVFRALLAAGQNCLATRVSPEQAAELLPQFDGIIHNAEAHTLRIMARPSPPTPLPQGERGERVRSDAPTRGKVVVVTAGTSDLPVAHEAVETARWMGCDTDLVVDVGVAGPQRLLSQLSRLTAADAIVVVAGMEGALPSVVGGHVAVPVIAVPTSIGYGASFQGLAALLGMLNSCAANVTVVNIDAGFKGGFVAGMIARGRRDEG